MQSCGRANLSSDGMAAADTAAGTDPAVQHNLQSGTVFYGVSKLAQQNH